MARTKNMRKDVLLEVNHLTIGILSNPEIIAVNDISFKLHAGEILGIAGESGSGKTLTALSIVGLLPQPFRVTSGSIRFQDSEGKIIDLCNAQTKEWNTIRGKQIGMIFQDPMTSLNPSLPCGFQIEEVLKGCGNYSSHELKAHCLHLLAETGLAEPERIRRSYPFQLSGGQRQRVMIAIAIAGNPKIIIADEPTTALDVSVQKSVIELLRNLCISRNMSLIFISHDLRIMKNIAPSIIIMHHGKIYESGNTLNILENPQTDPSKILIRSIPPLDRKPYRLGLPEEMGKKKNSPGSPDDPLSNKPASKNTQKEVLLKVNNLCVFYEQEKFPWGKIAFPALKNISFNLMKNETLGIIGESGSGKTTLARSILGLIPNVSGEIYFNGKPIHSDRKKFDRTYRKKMQIIFQDPYSSLNPRHTVQTILEEPLLVHEALTRKERITKVREILDHVKLPISALTKYPHEFSGGQRQRIAIARALILKPDLIICDECVASLDVSIQAQILNLLNDLKEEIGLSYLFVSHDLAVVKYMAQHIIVLRNGSITDAGETDYLWKNPESEYLRNLIESVY